MNWKSIKFLSDDDYGKPVLLRVTDKDCAEPRYISYFITGQMSIPTDAYYIRIDEILF